MVSADLSVAKAEQRDQPSLVAIMDEAMRYKARRGDFSWGREGNSGPRVSGALARGEMFVVRQAGEAIGTVCLQWDDERYWGVQPPVAGYLHGLAIRDAFRGTGLGRRVIDWAAAHVAAQGRHWLRLDCGAGNTGLCRYYEGQGFSAAGRQIFASGHVAALYQRGARVAPIDRVL